MTVIDTFIFELRTQLEDFLKFSGDNAPNLLVFAVLTVAGYFIAKLAGFLVTKSLYKLNLDKKVRRPDLNDSLGKVSLAKFFGQTTKWVVFLLFLTQAMAYLPFGIFSGLFSNLIAWLPKIIFGVVVVIFGVIMIDFISYKILDLKMKHTRMAVQVVKVILIIAIAVTAVDQLGVDISFLKMIFLIGFGAFALMIALAFGISLGLGLKEDARKMVKNLKRK